MSRILISWLAFANDFQRNEETGAMTVNEQGPTYVYHKLFYKDYKKHIILYSTDKEKLKVEWLQNKLAIDFRDHDVEFRHMHIEDIININEIKTKVESLLLSLSEYDIDLFYSPGTSAMQVSWYILHTTLGLKTRLIQTKSAKDSETGEPEWIEIITEQSTVPTSMIIKERSITERLTYKIPENIVVTEILEPVYEKAYKIARSDVTTVIMGETGTGKEHLARFIHLNSVRKNKPFIPVNCSAMGEQLLESRLFGYKKGAFTGAEKNTKGLIQEGDGGTVFLDEIGDMSLYMQMALLRLLQEKEIHPIGGLPETVDVRIIVATNKNLDKLCKEEKFRDDLYYRLMVGDLELPSLLERGKKDIEQLMDFFLEEKAKLYKRELQLSPEVSAFILNYPFPGNVRELENLIESLFIYGETEVTMKDIPRRFLQVPEEKSLLWKDVEKQHIEKVLRIKKGVQSDACKAIGYKSINTLRKKIQEYGIRVEEYGG